MVWRVWGRSQNNGMASREKKARSVTADSPTPSLGSANSGSNSNISAPPTTPSTTNASLAAGGSDSAPTTPTSTRKGVAGTLNPSSAVSSGNLSGSGSSSASTSNTRQSLSRLKSKQQLLQQNAGDEATAEDTVAGGVVDSIVTTPSRTTRGGASREDSAGRDSPATTIGSSKDKDDAVVSVSASKDVTKSPSIGARRATATSKPAASVGTTVGATETRNTRVVTGLKRTTLLKRKGKKIIGKPMLGRKVVARRQLVATAKSTGTRGAAAMVVKKEAISPSSSSTAKEKEEELPSTPSLRNGKPRNSDSPVAKRKSTTAVLKHQDSAKSLDSLTGSIKMERRRSRSVSKCSDLTEDSEPVGTDIKRELFDIESKSKMLDKMAEAFNERKTGGSASPVVAGSKEDKASGGTLRRSMRQRKSTAREKEDFLSPRGKAGSSLDIKIEPSDSLESLSVDGEADTNVTASVAAPLTIDTTASEVSIGTEPLHSDGAASSLGGGSSSSVSATGVGTGGEEELTVGKDPSLSPGELVSEGVSEQSVKECYSEPAFLENNLGIEKDPKLGEIVQERFRCDKVSDDVDANGDEAKNATGMGSIASDNGGGVMKIDNQDVVVEETESTSKELEVVVPTSTVKPIVKDEEMEIEEQENVEEQTEVVIRTNDQASEDQVEQDMGNSDECVDEPMEEESVVVSDELVQGDKNTETDKMDITEEEQVEEEKEEDEVVECVKELDDCKEVTETAEKQDDVMIILDEATEVVEVPEKTIAKQLSVEDNESVRTGDEDREIDASQASDVAPKVVETSSTSKPVECSTEKGNAACSPVSAATGSCKTNGESNGIAAPAGGQSRDQSTPNQQTSRAGQQKTPVANASSPRTTTPGNGKETKSKARTTKEKTKEDEKTREEKLRQEKLRVEEKVREEKQRAERLEAEKRLKEERLQQKMLENGLAEVEASPQPGPTTLKTATGTKSGGSSPAAADKETKTELTNAAITTALGGLNLPAITIAFTKRDSGSSSADEKESTNNVRTVSQKPKSELEILSIKADGSAATAGGSLPAVGLLSKEEKPTKEGGVADTAESRLRTISKSENAASAVSVVERKDSNKSPTATTSALSIIKIETINGSPVTVRSSTTPSPPAPNGKDAAEERKTVLLDESDDAAKRKESHLKHLGLLTIQAASEEKQRRAEQKPSAPMTDSSLQDSTGGAAAGGVSAGVTGGGEGWLSSGTNHQSSTGSGRPSGGSKPSRSSRDEYTVSMKTVVKGNGSGGSRGEKRKQQRMPLKMTFQKGKGKAATGGGNATLGRDPSNGPGTSSNGSGYVTDTGNNGDNTFYTAHINELDHHSSNSSDGHSHRESGAGRKAHSRSHTTDGVNLTEAVGETASSKEVIQKSLVIPEKASSFNVHPERLCWDQCSYCGGKFGLYDTPCHVAAIKSTERQQRILLATLPKITLDSCLCDACYRHVDRKANCPPQKKKSTTVSQTSSTSTGASTNTTTTQSTVSPLVLKVTTNKDGSTSIATEQPATLDDGTTAGGKERETCAVRQCTAHGMQSLRRKWMVKMKRKISKQLDINFELAAKATAEYIYICNKHYEQISHLMICALCTKPLQRNHVYHLFNNVVQLERLIQEQGISIRLSSSELVVCKLCKYYANLLIKPPDATKAKFIKDYNRRLYNYRQRTVEEQNVEVRSLEQTVVPAPRQRPAAPMTTDIVISDGDEEDEEMEEEEVEECPAPAQQQHHPEARYQTYGNLFSIGDSSVSLRRRISNRKSPDVTIVENNVATQMGELDEISILPASKSLAAMNQQQQHQQSQDDNIDMTKVLKSNPNISMRELFPGEEELGVHVNIPFSSSSVRTPEGWTKVTSTIQYDDSTRALWDELQKPYGNQSSFLRHLILLEKYFRNGDLVLSPQAKNNATTYSEAVQNRLRSYDNIPSSVPTSPPALAALATVTPSVAADKTSNIFQQFSSATITIVPASKVRNKTGSTTSALSSSSNTGNGPDVTPVSPPAPVSLLKSNNLHLANSSGEQGMKNSLKRKLSNEGRRCSFSASATSTPLSNSGSNASKVVKLDEVPKAALSSPPELISINCKPSVTITSIPPGQQPAPSAPSPAATTQRQLSLLNQSQQSLLQSVPILMAKKSPPAAAVAVPSTSTTMAVPPAASSNATGNATREIIQMPEQLTEAERRESSTRPWRPTLLPISPGVSESLKSGPLYQTADGRLLPKLVQVMSGGKPYHISIEDYNRMCILRREKLLQQQHNMIQTANKRQSQLPQPKPQVSTIPPPALRLTNTSVENSLINNTVATTSGATGGNSTAAKVVQFPNQLLEQNSLIPIYGGGATGKIGPGNGNVQKTNNSSLTVTMTPTVNNNSLAKGTTVIPPAMKSLSLPNSTTVYPMMMSANTISLPPLFTTSASSTLYTGVGGGVTTQSSTSSINNRPASATTSLVLAQPSSHLSMSSVTTMNPLDQLLKGGNLVTQAQLQEYVAAATAANGGGLGASSQMDNSPDKLLSKIPKSLTVIPQQKQSRTMSRVSSHEEQNSA
ncbi:mucin-12 [Anopheles moucheti]|uniref:mucin-12 n=1 Tax=Anopheles moucheti TaxID=186751 RepID=UPI0022F0683E|nr:mucin-12 [Anopheles moucheti]